MLQLELEAKLKEDRGAVGHALRDMSACSERLLRLQQEAAKIKRVLSQTASDCAVVKMEISSLDREAAFCEDRMKVLETTHGREETKSMFRDMYRAMSEERLVAACHDLGVKHSQGDAKMWAKLSEKAISKEKSAVQVTKLAMSGLPKCLSGSRYERRCKKRLGREKRV